MHALSPETDNCPSWISGKERMTIVNISWSISTKECCRPGGGRTCNLLITCRTNIQLSHRGWLGNSVQTVFVHFRKWIWYKRKEFASQGSKFFPFRADPFSEGAWCAVEKQEVTKVVSLVKIAENLLCVSSPLKKSSGSGVWIFRVIMACDKALICFVTRILFFMTQKNLCTSKIIFLHL